MAKVIPSASPDKEFRHVGFLSGQISVPDDFDRMGGGEIAGLFEGKASETWRNGDIHTA